jgi:hypothetical protein
MKQQIRRTETEGTLFLAAAAGAGKADIKCNADIG